MSIRWNDDEYVLYMMDVSMLLLSVFHVKCEFERYCFLKMKVVNDDLC